MCGRERPSLTALRCVVYTRGMWASGETEDATYVSASPPLRLAIDETRLECVSSTFHSIVEVMRRRQSGDMEQEKKVN